MVDSSSFHGADTWTIAADGMAIPNDEILTGALCIAGFIFAAVGCVSLLTWKK
jgi:hypothetical protein